ncbi:invasion associated locus B family protein [Frigidibacter albus]|uniref:Invasion protein IalB n=2 Tax=Frigidibacter mobilis TaxID=1335048 RepID=A0A159Z1V3_9RHOB|nr:hypothetical protein AKL17_1679 [Frigidibacter mobilis]
MPVIPTTLRAAILLLACSTAAHAQEATDQPQPPLWIIACSNENNPEELLCEFSQSIVMTAQNGQSQRVATLSFARMAGQADTQAFLALPLEVALTDQVQISVDGSERATLAWQSCDNSSCYATADVDEAWLAAMRKGAEMTAQFKARDQREVNFGFQLRDFLRTEQMLP